MQTLQIRRLTFPGWATSTTAHSYASDPAEAEAVRCLEQGTLKLEEGDVNTAKDLYQRSVEIKRSPSALFNLGVTHYHLSKRFIMRAGTSPSNFLQRNLTRQLLPGKSPLSCSRQVRTLTPVRGPFALGIPDLRDGTWRLGQRVHNFPSTASRPRAPTLTVSELLQPQIYQISYPRLTGRRLLSRQRTLKSLSTLPLFWKPVRISAVPAHLIR